MNVDGTNVSVNGRNFEVMVKEGFAAGPAHGPANSGGKAVSSEMPGKIIRVDAQVGDHVEAGDSIMVIEAMKMEMSIAAPVSGTVSAIEVEAGDQIVTGQALAHIA